MPASTTSRRLLCAIAFVNVAHAAITKIYPEGVTQCPESPRLECQHNTQCVIGDAVFEPKHAHLDLKTSEGGYHCSCPDGYIGHQCEVIVESCDDGPDIDGDGVQDIHSCYHGTTCTYSSHLKMPGDTSIASILSGYASCDCDTLNAATSATMQKVAGLMCEHKSTAFCAVEMAVSEAPLGQFCTNHGQCVRRVDGSEVHPGCHCENGWAGDHCEIADKMHATMADLMRIRAEHEAQGQEEEEKKGAGKALFSLLIVAIAGVVGGMTVYALKKRRQQAALAEVSNVEAELDFEADDAATEYPTETTEEGEFTQEVI